MKDLPNFQPRSFEAAFDFISAILTTKDHPDDTLLVELIQYDDGHYRAVFDPAYFTLQPGEAQPTRSQWNTLKKKLKRHDPTVFVFKEHGEVACEGAEGGRCYYVDFGFLAG